MGHLPLLKMTGIIRNDTEEVSVGHIGEAESVVIIHLLQLQQQQVHIGAKLPSNLYDIKAIADQFLNGIFVEEQVGSEKANGCCLQSVQRLTGVRLWRM